jgi:RNA polymerase sigma-70 factor (ECF subfamily)
VNQQALITALQHNDPDALAQVFAAYSNKLYRLALSLLHDEQQADGVVQNTFMALITHIDTFEGRANLGTWLYRVAYNDCLQRLRKIRPELALDDMADEGDMDTLPACLINWQEVPEAIASSHEALGEMERAINSLKPEMRVVFTLRDIEELSTHETAAILGISEALVKVRLHRARLKLREQLARYYEDYARREQS